MNWIFDSLFSINFETLILHLHTFFFLRRFNVQFDAKKITKNLINFISGKITTTTPWIIVTHTNTYTCWKNIVPQNSKCKRQIAIVRLKKKNVRFQKRAMEKRCTFDSGQQTSDSLKANVKICDSKCMPTTPPTTCAATYSMFNQRVCSDTQLERERERELCCEHSIIYTDC